MRRVAILVLAALPLPALAQTVVTSPSPTKVSVTIYRDPERGLEPLQLNWLNGYALVSETRHVRLPAGESELRFVGVTNGIVPQTALVTGLGSAVIEKNRDARLLSPGALLDASLGERLTLRRTSRKTGQVIEQDAIVRATAEGVVLQTAAGIEALRCTGMAETVVANRVPQDLSAQPTLSVRIRSPEPVERDVTLSYISNNFDWQADYVAELSPAGDRLSLFAWMTVANGDSTGLVDAQTQAVAGKLNRSRVWVDRGHAYPINILCWPQATTSDIPAEQGDGMEMIVVTGSRVAAPPAPPAPPAPAAERDEGFAMKASEERLGDVRLYRIPEPVTVAGKSQKQIALLSQPSVRFTTVLRLRPPDNAFEGQAERILVTRNRQTEGLGLALPAGNFALFARRGDRRILVGEGRMDDHAVAEKVEIPIDAPTGVNARQARCDASHAKVNCLTITSDLARPQVLEVELPLSSTALGGAKLRKREGWMLWRVVLAANGQVELHWTS